MVNGIRKKSFARYRYFQFKEIVKIHPLERQEPIRLHIQNKITSPLDIPMKGLPGYLGVQDRM